ncbi:hypothetical protein [Aliivibrio fischeri]|uniref:Uncharacterized protein n=1 Tax=Aliivibrio fischeri SR5 TaxID=1088719 RepID=A0AAV3EN88_ALIFS|nr:hypothetical protein [Aliivibrio fischeri]EHN67994.1 hypothetical protein VFSR5_2719 [Aliivibrio fischeri SR5]
MKLQELNNDNFCLILEQHHQNGGTAINDALGKLFDALSDERNYYEVTTKVAALNTMYSTAIQYIYPVVDKIHKNISNEHDTLTLDGYVQLVDKISQAKWVSKSNGNEISRNNLSFASKYIHFLSKRTLPIYDSYIWIVMIGYLNQRGNSQYRFDPPNNYEYFYSVFCIFKEKFNLECYSNYDIDKYLWQYGKTLIFSIMEEDGVSMDKAKRELKNRITKQSTRC